MDIAPLLDDARRFLELDFEFIKQHPLQMYDFAHVWIPKKSLSGSDMLRHLSSAIWTVTVLAAIGACDPKQRACAICCLFT